jgi:hypothetical protein
VAIDGDVRAAIMTGAALRQHAVAPGEQPSVAQTCPSEHTCKSEASVPDRVQAQSRPESQNDVAGVQTDGVGVAGEVVTPGAVSLLAPGDSGPVCPPPGTQEASTTSGMKRRVRIRRSLADMTWVSANLTPAQTLSTSERLASIYRLSYICDMKNGDLAADAKHEETPLCDQCGVPVDAETLCCPKCGVGPLRPMP